MILNRIKSSWNTPWQRMLYIMFFAQLMTGVGFSSIFPFLPLYIQDLGSSTGTSLELLAGLVYSGQAFTMMLASPLWGSVADRYGRKLMVERAQFGGVAILLLMAFARSAEELVLLRAIQGFITGTVSAVNALVAAQTPREHSGFAMGFVQVGMGAGVALGPMIGGAISDAYGYAPAFYVTALLLFLAGMVVHLWIDEPEAGPGGLRQARTGRAEAAPGNPGQPDGAARRAAPHRRLGAGMLASWKKILAQPGVPAAYGLSFLNNLCRNMLLPVLPLFIPLILAETELVNSFTGLVVGISSATNTLSSVYLGRLGDRVGQRRVLIVSLVAASILYAVQSLVNAGWQLLLMQAVVGVALGGIIPSISALLARFTQRGTEGVVYGLENSIASGARSLAPMLGSAIMVWWGLRSTFVVTGGLLLLTALFAVFSLPRQIPLRGE